MLRKPKRGLFITGTNTEVGKTFVGVQIVRALRDAGRTVGVYKPAESGCRREGDQLIPSDASALLAAAELDAKISEVCPQTFEAPLAPHLAARSEGREIDIGLLREGLSVWTDRCEIVIVEGAGGLMSPISDDEYVADLANDFGYPLIVVSPNTLGTINQTLQTLITAATFRNGLDVAGIVLNDVVQNEEDVSAESNYQQLSMRCVPRLLAHVRWKGTLPQDIDWFERSLAGSHASATDH